MSHTRACGGQDWGRRGVQPAANYSNSCRMRGCPASARTIFSQIRPTGEGVSTVVPQVEPHCGHRYSYLSPSGRTRSRRLRTGTARLQRGQASRVASIRSKAGFRGAGIALQTITTDATNAKVEPRSRGRWLRKSYGNQLDQADHREFDHLSGVVPPRPKGGRFRSPTKV